MLGELQRRFTAEDPEFVRSFEDVDRSTQWSLESIYAKPAWVFTVALVVAVAVAVLMMLLQAPATAFTFAAVATGIAVLRHHRCKDAGARGS
ncbi:hypothetical protein GCM10009559_21250 [Pseudonocardia zijingensis]|uniref:DUF3040 family protein n=1 Tax=Pseudonocardia zijingensis TaxID=153376 RepID=A0ABN1PT44_9PSEU